MNMAGQPPLPSESTRITCPHCNADVQTETVPETGRMTHIAALVLCCFVCWPCVCLPYCTDCTKDIIHNCPACKRMIGIYKR